MSPKLDILRKLRARPAAATAHRPTIYLAVYQSELIHLGAGRHTLLSESDDSQHYLDPQRLAEAARHLLPDTDTQQGVALFLPAHEFAATPVKMPGVSGDNLANAVRLQQPMLLPGVTEPLLLAIQAPTTPRAQHIALWLVTARAEKLFQAFAAKGLFLSHILPRPLALVQDSGAAQAFFDADDSTLTYLEWQDNSLSQWLYITREDYAQEVFRAQFDAATQLRAPAEAHTWQALPVPEVLAYALIPPGAAVEIRRRRKAKLWRQGKVVAALFSILLILVSAGLWLRMHRLEQRLAALKEQTTDVARLRAEIITIEEKIGPVIHFPEQDVIGILLKLNQIVPKDSFISAFKISDGLVEIEGSSSSPTDLLEVLIQDPLFAEVAFSRPTQGDRFGIKFRLVGVDVPAYLQEYFPPGN
jgi:hypothetical protein